ncbi:LOW QUALITY PROTEIN: protocadherin-11 X-linked-like [Pomacea canaliculata]|uniref:LOW QUALITY PROTEIN: protocadherin-11 X-linked-like n=1 Tax=Pomacea canaliculata TaxID=400727 RepID=UPI000D72B4AF|nr:LOW QUALITY PROTEIN: protocadherin-11 X-linked-like [Pomacea canaliculata]
MTVSVLVLDVNDNAPTFTKAVYSVNVSESAPEGTAILTVSATDPDDGDNAALQYTISVQQPSSERQKLRVGAKDGVVTLAKALNVGVHRVLVEVQDGGSPPMAAQAVVQVTVLDTDNNPPALNVDLLSVLDMKPGFVPERAKVSTAVAYMAVSDPDTNANGIVTCSCHSDRFDLQPLDLNEYKVIINMPLDREEEDHYTVLITCADGGSPRLSASATFDIWVVDANDNAPAFLQKDHFVSVAENNSPSDGLIQVAATDADSGDNANVTYSLLGAEGNFLIGAQNGLVKVIHKFNYEQRSRYVFYVLATDHGDPPLTSTATVTVNVLDVNDEIPTFSAQEYVMSVDESVKPGTYIGNVSAFDPDTGPGGQVVLSIVQSLGSDFPIPFAIRNTGVIVTTGPLDREQRGSYVLYVMAKDQGSQPLSSTALVRIDILDINDNPPQFVFPENGSNTYTLPIPVQANFIVGTVRAVDPDSGLNSVVSYSTVGGNSSYFRVDEFTGSLITARDMDEAQVGSYYLLVRATDKGSPPLSSEQKISLYVTRHVSGELTGDDDRYIVIVIVIVVFTVVVAAGVFTTLCVLRKLDQDRKLKYRAACCPDTDAGGQLEMAGTQCPADNQQVHSLSHDVEKMSKRGCSSTSDSAYASSEVGETGSHTIGSSSMLGLPRQRTCYVRGSQSFMLTPSYGQQGRKAPLFHPETGHRADDFHSTSSTETTAGDSGHGSDEEIPSSSSVHNIRRGRCATVPSRHATVHEAVTATRPSPLCLPARMNTSFYFDTPLSTFSRSLQPHGTAGGKVREGRNPNNVRFSPNVTYENSSAHPPFQTRGRCAASDEDSELDTTTSGSYSVATDDVYGDWVHHAGAIYSNGNGSGEGHYKNVEHDLLV